LAELKIKDRNAVLGILDDLRVLLLKHKVKNEHKREDIESMFYLTKMKRKHNKV
jgi:hypothetical protein